MSNKKISQGKIKFFQDGFKSLVQEDNHTKFMQQLEARKTHSKINNDPESVKFFENQKKLFR